MVASCAAGLVRTVAFSFIVLNWREDYRELKTMPVTLPRSYFRKTNIHDELREVVFGPNHNQKTSAAAEENVYFLMYMCSN